MENITKYLSTKMFEGRLPKSAKIPLDKIEGKDAEKNGTDGKIGYNEPTDNTAQKVQIDKEKLNRNLKRLLMKFKTEEDFFIQGRAGWGKTSTIKDLAKKFGYEVITFYLDKCEATDLGGIPVPVKGDDDIAEQQSAMPKFAVKMLRNPNTKYLLFFDEMNQAEPRVMNALMPIVLEHTICDHKFDNFFVGAAGNFDFENEFGVSEMSKPLQERFAPIIVWETGGEAWKQAFDYLHKTWDEKFGGPEFINLFEENPDLFDNPRRIERPILSFVYKLKKSGDNDYFDADDYLDRLMNLTKPKEELTRTEEKQLSKLADSIYEFVNKNDVKKESSRSSKKNINMVSQKIIDAIKDGMEWGYITQKEGNKYVKYGISRENIGKLDHSDEINAEMLQRIINKIEADGIKFKYEKDDEWRKAGYKDPLED